MPKLVIATAPPAYTASDDTVMTSTPLLCQYIHDNMDGDIQQIFVESFLATVNDSGVKFPVRGQDALEWLGYGNKGNFKAFFSTHLKEGVDFEVFLRPQKNPLGGRAAEEVHFTVNAFKRLGMLAKTEKGMQVREYYLQLENLMHKFSIRQKQVQLEEAWRAREIAVHHALIQGHANRGVVYISRMKQVDKHHYIIKIGWSDDAEARNGSLKTDFGDHFFVHIVDVMQPAKFEDYLKKHPRILPYKDSNHYNSTETFLVTDEVLEDIKAIIRKDRPGFDTLDRREELELRRLVAREDEVKIATLDRDLRKRELDIREKELDIREKELAVNQTLVSQAQRHLDDITAMMKTSPREKHLFDMYKLAQDHLRSVCAASNSGSTASICARSDRASASTAMIEASSSSSVPEGKRKFFNYIQKYDRITLKLLGVYEGPNDAVNSLGEGAPQNLTDAARAKKEYCGFRWAEVSKASGIDPKISQDIGETVAVKACHGGYIARLSEDLTTVTDVYASQSEAAEKTNRTASAVCAMLKKSDSGRESSRWIRWSNVSQDMKDEYLDRRTLPPLPKRNGRSVLQLDSKTKEVIAKHETAAKVVRLFGVGTQSLKEACDGTSPAPLKGYCWKWADDE